MERKDERLMEERILKWQEYHGTKGNITYTQRQSSKNEQRAVHKIPKQPASKPRQSNTRGPENTV
jgi:hypothetical protein